MVMNMAEEMPFEKICKELGGEMRIVDGKLACVIDINKLKGVHKICKISKSE